MMLDKFNLTLIYTSQEVRKEHYFKLAMVAPLSLTLSLVIIKSTHLFVLNKTHVVASDFASSAISSP